MVQTLEQMISPTDSEEENSVWVNQLKLIKGSKYISQHPRPINAFTKPRYLQAPYPTGE